MGEEGEEGVKEDDKMREMEMAKGDTAKELACSKNCSSKVLRSISCAPPLPVRMQE